MKHGWILVLVVMASVLMAPVALAESPRDHHQMAKEDAHRAMDALMHLAKHPYMLHQVSADKAVYLLKGVDRLAKLSYVDHDKLFNMQVRLTLRLMDIQVKRLYRMASFGPYYRSVHPVMDARNEMDRSPHHNDDMAERDDQAGYQEVDRDDDDDDYRLSGYYDFKPSYDYYRYHNTYYGGYNDYEYSYDYKYGKYRYFPTMWVHKGKSYKMSSNLDLDVHKMRYNSAYACHAGQLSATRHHARDRDVFVGPCQQVGYHAWTFNVWMI